MSLSVSFASTLTVVQTDEGEYVSPADPTVTIIGLNEAATYTGSTAVPVTKHTAFQKALSSGTGTIDLTSLPDHNGVAGQVDGTGLKVQFARFRNLSTNANDITITFGASNPYNLLGSAFVIVLAPGQMVSLKLDEAAPDIASGAKDIDISGTGAQILEVQLVMG